MKSENDPSVPELPSYARVRKKDFLAVVTPLGDMVGKSGKLRCARSGTCQLVRRRSGSSRPESGGRGDRPEATKLPIEVEVMSTSRSLIGSALWLWCSVGLLASGTVGGSVFESNGKQPVFVAKATLQVLCGAVEENIQVDDNGDFFASLPDGKYRLIRVVSAEKQELLIPSRQMRTFVVRTGRHTRFDVQVRNEGTLRKTNKDR